MPEYAWPINKSLSVRFKSLENQSTDELRLKFSDMRKNPSPICVEGEGCDS